jgi:hypothetical protein
VKCYGVVNAHESPMPQLTIVNQTQCTVEVTINDEDPPRRLNPGGNVILQRSGPVRLYAKATEGPGAKLIRPGDTADGLVQNRTLVLDADPNTAQLRFTVS